MHDRRTHFGQTRDLAIFQMDGMAIKAARAQKAEHLIGIQIVAGLRKQIPHPCNLGHLFAQVGLHQAIGMLCP